MVAKLPIRILGNAFNVALLLVVTFYVGYAHSLTKPSEPRTKGAKRAAIELDTNRYIGLTIFNFERIAERDDERIRHSAQHGCNAVEITINWDRIYPTINSTAYWDVVDSHIRTAEDHNLKIALRVHVGRDADKLGGFWGVHETMQAADSARNTKTGIVQFTFAHERTVDRAMAFVQEVASRYHYLQKQGKLLFFSVVSSPALEAEYTPVYDPPSGSGKYVVPYDYSIHELTGFRQYLQARFSLSQLNQRWGTDFSTWNKVMPPANNKSNPYAVHDGVRGQDWYVFRHRQLKKFIDKVDGAVKSVDPSIVVINQHGCVWDRLSGLRATFAFKNLAENADGLKFNDGPDYNHRFSMDVVRSNLKPGAFMVNAVDGMFHPSVSAEKYYEQIAQCYEHGAKMLTLANFGGLDARPKLEKLIHMVVDSNKLLQKRVTQVQTVGAAIGYKLSDILKSSSIAQERWSQRYNQNGKKPVRIELDEDLLRNEPPVINSLPVVSKPLVDQNAIVGQPFSYSIGSTFTDSDGTIVSVEASNLPIGIGWSSATGEFSGTPTRVEATLVTLTARDNLGATVTASFRLTVTDPTTTNQPPVAPIVAAQNGQVGTAFAYTLPAFTDPENLPLSHSLTGLPAGLTFSTETRVLSGTPATAGVYSLTYSASDPSEIVSTTFFQFTVKDVPPPPIRTGNFEGYFDTYNCEGDIWGWVWDRNLPNTPMPIEVLDGLNVIGKFTADLYRPDLVAAKKGNAQHGYQFLIPNSVKDGLPHVISMRIENSEYYLKGSPKTVVCPPSTAQTTDPSNKPPVAVPIPIQNAYLQVPFSYTLPEFTHEDGQTLIYAVSGGVAGLTYNQATRTFSGVPSQTGTFTASVIVSDGEGGYTPATVTVVVTAAPANRPPVVAQPIPNQTATVDQAFTYTLPANTFTDPDNNLTGLQVSGLPNSFSYTTANRTISGTPTAAGIITVTVKAVDAVNASVTTTFNITVEAPPVQNQPPVIVQDPVSQTAVVGQSYHFQIPLQTFSDPDGTIASIAVSGLPAGLTYTQSSRTISGTLTTPQTATISVTATDNGGATVTVSFQLTVVPPANQTPKVSSPIPDQVATVGKALTYQLGAETFADSDGRIENVEIVSGLPAGLTYTQSSRTISGTPTTPTTTTVTVKATDNEGASVTTTFRFTVNAAPIPDNKPPVVVEPIPDQTATIGQAFTYAISGSVFTDPDGNITTVEVLSSLPDGLTYSPPVRTISGVPSAKVAQRGLTASVSEPLITTVVVKATDNHGGWVTTSFRLTVNPAPNEPPVVSSPIPAQTATVGKSFVYTIGDDIFSDSDGHIANVEVSGLPTGLAYTQHSRVIAGIPTVAGSATVTVTATDNQGATVTTSFRLTVSPAPNEPPVVSQTIPDQSATVGQNFSYTLGTGVFTDPDGVIARVEITSGLPTGLAYTQHSRVIAGTPTAAGSSTVTVKATDNQGATVTTTFRLTVSPAPNEPPVVSQTIPDQTATVGQTFTYTIGAGVFTDPDGSIAKVEITSGLPAGLTYTQNTRSMTGKPTTAGVATVTVKATDNQGAAVTTTFRVTVNPAPSGGNQPPVLLSPIPDQTFVTSEEYTYMLGKTQFTDPDGSIASVEIAGLPAGLVYNKAAGIIGGKPSKAGVYKVEVKAIDNKGASTTVNFTITVIENAVMKLYKAGKGPEAQNFIQELKGGEVLYLTNLPASVNFFFEFVTKVSSVKFELRGPKTVVFQENFAPWALCGDNGGTNLLPGTYSLKVTGYKKPNLQSNLLVERLIVFEVKSSSGKRENAETAVASSEPVTGVWGVYPNPFRDQLVVTIPGEAQTAFGPLAPYRFSIVSPSGQQYTVPEQDTRIEGSNAILNVQAAGLQPGLYFLQIRRGEGRLHTLKIVKE
ncbi:putative Ig domain-containing protein [Larkinella bovis]|uniref:Ig domain-containing protein n=1 Tax=Larkinella bovis TaxID=683041 RepID=A0ABW0IAC2_9BACT